MKARILVVDDDTALCSMLVEQLRRMGYTAEPVNTLNQGLTAADKNYYDVVLLDVQMPDGNGLEYIPQFLLSHSRPEVIIVTGHGAPDGAEKAIHGGAWSYIEKPHIIRDIPLHLTRALQYREEKRKTKAPPVVLKRKNIIGNSEAIIRCLDGLATTVISEINVLITGETGTGKEVFAQAIHDNSTRAEQSFVVVDCASLPESLIESALFGYAKGAFTGANVKKEGLIQQADGGTLFLDEVGELAPGMQKTFLRVLQERSYRPLGATGEIQSKFRLVAATNKNLEQLVEKGIFRKDLLYRLKGTGLHLPPLRERKEDISDLVQYCLTRLCERYKKDTKGVSVDLIEALTVYDWPGNVRELFQVVEHVFAEAIAVPTIFCAHLPHTFRIRMAQAGMQYREQSEDEPQSIIDADAMLPWRDYKNHVEKKYLVRLMKESDGNVQTACHLSRLSRARIYQLLGKYDISED